MNINPNATKVLCYGDSNTWGQTPDKTGRQAADVRWTGRLQQLLGDGYYLIEEGLPSRTTDLDYESKPGRNGKTYLAPCLGSHLPIDMVVLMLGTNDFKTVFKREASEVARAVRGLILDIKLYGKYMGQDEPRIILLSPIHINTDAPEFMNFYSDHYDVASSAKSLELADELRIIAETEGCDFLDTAIIAQPGIDGIHLSKEAHEPLAQALCERIKLP